LSVSVIRQAEASRKKKKERKREKKRKKERERERERERESKGGTREHRWLSGKSSLLVNTHVQSLV